MRKILLLVVVILFLFIDLKAQWIKTSGPSGGYADRIVSIEDTLFISAPYDGIYRSKDHGTSWELVNSGLPEDDIESIFSTDNTIYASIEDNGIYFSEDIGENWIPINNGIESMTFYRIIAEDSVIYVSNSQGGVYYSSDNGQNWTDKSNGILGDVIYSFEMFDSKIFAGGDSLYFSTDNGDNWETIEIDGITSKIMSIVSTDTVMFLKSSSSIYVSTDSSKTWTKSSINTSAAYGKMSVYRDTVFVTSSSGIVYFSIDNWDTWEMKQNPLTSVVKDICVLPGSYFMTSWDGIYKSDDNGDTWNYSDNGFARLRIYSMTAKDSFIFVGTDNKGVFRTSDNGENWISMNDGLNNANSKDINNMVVLGDEVLLATLDGLYKSSNDGDSWDYVNDPGSQGIHMMVSDKGKLAAYVYNNGVYTSVDTGSTWTLASTVNFDQSYIYYCMEMKGDSILLGTHSGNILISKNSGSTWIDTTISSENMTIFDIDFYHDTLFVATSSNLYYSIDMGESWNTFDNGLTSNYVKYFYEANDKYFVSTTYGEVFIYSKKSNKWYPYTDNFDNSVTDFLYADGILYLGTDRSSVWKRENLNISPTITGTSSNISTPEETELEIQVSDLIIDDPDNDFPEDFNLTVNNGDNYTLNENQIIPDTDFNGNLTVPVVVNDGYDDSPVFNVSIEVTAVNDTPVIISADTLLTIESTSIEITLDDLTINDPDNTYPNDFNLTVYEGDNYTFSNNTVTPVSDFTGYLTVPVSVNDGSVDGPIYNVIIDVAEATGIENYSVIAFEVYPNPANQHLNIEFNNKLLGKVEIKIIDLLGKVIVQENYSKSEFLFQKEMNIEELPNGTYFVEISQLGDFRLVERIVKY